MEALADEVSATRPLGDPDLEQFHLQSSSLAMQARFIVRRFEHRSVLFLGDDDHVSIMAASFANLTGLVIEMDERVVLSLREWKVDLGLDNLQVLQGDIREVRPVDVFESFYVNPPYSSKNAGHGIRYWIDRATEFCSDSCTGLIAMPVLDGARWVDENWLDTQEFLGANGYRILHTSDEQTLGYENVNDIGLRSQNLLVQRVDPSRRRLEPPREGAGLYR